jgi:NAD(P)-dependent dehydrogenase (short-subunit alcohol dehydrogenase family)
MNRNAAFDLTGTNALITGGGTGLGFAMARCLADSGARVVLVGRRVAELDQASRSIGSAAFALPGDVTRLEELPALAERAEQIAGPINLLINNAGNQIKKATVQFSDAEFAAVMQTHVAGAFALTRECGRRMTERRSGCVLFIASMASYVGIPSIIAYAAAKSAYLGMIRSLATEWGPLGVRVNGIAPGWIVTAILNQALNPDPARKAKILGRIPLGGFGDPEDIGWAAVYLSSPAAKYVSGTVLTVDGGAVDSL